jgi:hypothetical protein
VNGAFGIEVDVEKFERDAVPLAELASQPFARCQGQGAIVDQGGNAVGEFPGPAPSAARSLAIASRRRALITRTQ